MIPVPSAECRTPEAELATALAMGRARHRGRPWTPPARSLLAGVTTRCHGQVVRANPPRRVLCADRHALHAESLAGALRRAGFDARWCSDGPTALVEVTDFRPHACVLDLDTPGVGGCELARWVRSEVGDLVFLVGAADRTGDELDRVAAEAGFDLVLARPADAGLVIGLLAGHARSGVR